MNTPDLKEVRSTPLFAKLTDEQLRCLDGGTVIAAPVGTVLATEGEQTGVFDVLLEGELRITRNYDRQTVLMAVTKPGNYIGEVMLLLGVPWLATVRVSKPARLFRLDEESFWRMLSTCPSVAREIFRSASNRMRNMEGYSHQREKLISLGTMAAGLAHELNNPASAARRAAAHLQETTDGVQSFICQLGKVLDAEHWEYLVGASLEASKRAVPKLDHLARSDREDAVAKWLDGHQVPAAWELAPTFVNAGLDSTWLAELTAKLPPASHTVALRWLEARLNLKSLISQVEQSTGRMAELVKAVKSYSYMDKTPLQEVDIHDHARSQIEERDGSARIRSVVAAHHGLWERTQSGLDQSNRQRHSCGQGGRENLHRHEPGRQPGGRRNCRQRCRHST